MHISVLRSVSLFSSVAHATRHTPLKAAGLTHSHTRSHFTNSAPGEYPILGDASLMKAKAHGSTDKPVQQNLKWGVDRELADRICCFNRHYAEPSGYFEYTRKNSFLTDISHDDNSEITFFDSVSGKPLYIAPRGRTFAEFLEESRKHGWPSFRDSEVVWENVRCLKDGEAVSVDGTHLGHNLPDKNGNRYCINLVSIAGNPK